MGCDWYLFKALASSGYAVMIANKDIKEVRSAGSSNKENEQFDDPLNEEEIEWLLDQTTDFKAYELGKSFVLFMKKDHQIVQPPTLDVPGPYEIEERYVSCEIEKAPDGDEFNELFALARKLTPQDNKLSFPPGRYTFSMTSEYLMQVEELKRMEAKLTASDQQAPTDVTMAPSEVETSIPFDFELVIGKEDKKNIIHTHKSVLACFIPKFESLVGDLTTATKLELPDLDHKAVKTVLDVFTTRKNDARMPDRWHKDYQASKLVLETFGLDNDYQHKTKKAKTDDAIFQHPALTDPRWLDVTFIVGSNKEEVKANRAVLASLNPVLRRILFGTGHITVDPLKPIDWTEFDAGAVRCVFLALVQLGKEEVVVPLASVSSAKHLVDYLMESHSDLNLYYETPFKREFEDAFQLVPGEEGEGLKLGVKRAWY